MNNKVKKQHYVPRFLLKKFGNNDNVNIYDFTKNEVRINQPIEQVFQELYFYGEDNVVEKILGKIEDVAASKITSIIAGHYSSLNMDKTDLIRFINSLLMRTKQSRNRVQKYHYEMQKNNLDEIIFSLLDSSTEEEIEMGLALTKDPGDFIYDNDDFRKIAGLSTTLGILMAECLKDLTFHVLINKSNLPFIISDNPVCVYNPLNEQTTNYSLVTDAFIIGTILLLPISQNMYLCAYDSNIYAFHVNQTTNLVEQDVRWLNLLQAVNSTHAIAFSNKTKARYIQGLADVSRHQAKMPCLPKFFKIKQGASRNITATSYRSPESMSNFFKFLNNAIDKLTNQCFDDNS